jgi:hypothetical protein
VNGEKPNALVAATSAALDKLPMPALMRQQFGLQGMGGRLSRLAVGMPSYFVGVGHVWPGTDLEWCGLVGMAIGLMLTSREKVAAEIEDK